MPVEQPPMTLQQYLILSVMAFRGEGVRLKVEDIARDVEIVKAWIEQWRDDPVMGRWCDLALSGHLYFGVVDGRVAFRPSGKGGESVPSE